MALEEIRLKKHSLGCYALESPSVPEDREAFFQMEHDVVALAEHMGYAPKGWDHPDGYASDYWPDLTPDERADYLRGARSYLDNREGEKLSVDIFDAYFEAQDRGWE